MTVTDPAEIRARYKPWQVQVLFSTIIGYAIFYFVRKNLSVAMPMILKMPNMDKKILGAVLTVHGLVYGASKFAHGFVGDRANARRLMVTGIVGSDHVPPAKPLLLRRGRY